MIYESILINELVVRTRLEVQKITRVTPQRGMQPYTINKMREERLKKVQSAIPVFSGPASEVFYSQIKDLIVDDTFNFSDFPSRASRKIIGRC